MQQTMNSEMCKKKIRVGKIFREKEGRGQGKLGRGNDKSTKKGVPQNHVIGRQFPKNQKTTVPFQIRPQGTQQML